MADASAQQLTMFIVESRVISHTNVGMFNNYLQKALDDGFIQHGTPFAWGDEIAVNVIKIDPRLMDMAKKLIDVGIAQLNEMGL